MTMLAASDCPVRLAADYSAAPRNRWTILLRLVLAIPLLILLGVFSGGSIAIGDANVGTSAEVALTGAGVLFGGEAAHACLPPQVRGCGSHPRRIPISRASPPRGQRTPENE
jgi:hypothetical protein